MNKIGYTLADTLIADMPKSNDSVERWIVISVISVFLLLFFFVIYNQIRSTRRNDLSLQKLHEINERNTRIFEILASNVTTMLLAGQQGKIYVLSLSNGIDLFRAVLKGHCYQKVDIMVYAISSPMQQEFKVMLQNVMQKFKELTLSEVQLLNKIVCDGKYLGEPLEIFINNKWGDFEAKVSELLNKYYRVKDYEAFRLESYNMMWEEVEKIIQEIYTRYCYGKDNINGIYNQSDSSK